jgi:hypothetical protein
MVWELWDEIKKNSKARIESKFNLQNQKKGWFLQVGTKMVHAQAKVNRDTPKLGLRKEPPPPFQ